MTNRDMFLTVYDTPTSVSGEWVLRAHYIVREAAEPAQPGESVKAAIRRAAQQLGISFRRATTFWYCRPCAVLAAEMAHLERVSGERMRERRARLQRELLLLEARMASLGETHAETVAGALGAAYGAPGTAADGSSREGRCSTAAQAGAGGSLPDPAANPLKGSD